MSRRVQYASSLFVDTFEKVVGAHLVKPCAPILVLTGNIGKLTSFQTHAFLGHCSRLWDSVLYVPGHYELSSPIIPINKANIHYLHNKSITINNIKFMGSPYLTKEDKEWVITEFSQTPVLQSVVALTYSIPNNCMIHSEDAKKTTIMTNFILGDLYPCVNAWISGYKRGAKTAIYENGVLAAYNARGHIGSDNDFQGKHGWMRDAFLDVPPNRPISCYD